MLFRILRIFYCGLDLTMGGGTGLTVKYVTSKEVNTTVLSAGVNSCFENRVGADPRLVYKTCTLSGCWI